LATKTKSKSVNRKRILVSLDGAEPIPMRLELPATARLDPARIVLGRRLHPILRGKILDPTEVIEMRIEGYTRARVPGRITKVSIHHATRLPSSPGSSPKGP
jgi:hypothetical protein